MGGAAVVPDVPVPAVLVGERAQELGAAQTPSDVIDAVFAFPGLVWRGKKFKKRIRGRHLKGLESFILRLYDAWGKRQLVKKCVNSFFPV